ncbi:MAG: CoB--CoM heterodisulfide reductase iron-sulfur subunit A family protein [Candidatus Bathyarchaeota archaeon]|nr:CoB--CoM heterodisulfide reductase iron-sulfur subunit A family protein [Candidatus Bathyarchaeota archaeon]MDH5689409.1 CoB--CoM heterodisulfide reductase iron-sulfur subunit A family protein [Candidatus Bathyarchaeota archaeon]
MAGKSEAVLVIGGGIAGIQAALDLGDMGIKVHLVEKKPAIGGRMAQLDKTFPTNDCSICILAPKLADCFRHPNIALHTLSEVKEVTGQIGDFLVRLRRNARFVDEEKCVNCGDCAAKCPVKVPDEFDMGLRRREAIYPYYLQGVPSVMAIDREHCLYLTRDVCRICERFCTREAIDFEQKDTDVMVNVGAIIIATGFDLYDPSGILQYGYKRYRNVITSLEYERLICASGPTGGHLVRPSDNKPAEKIAFVQCVGSRDFKNNRYCSSVCCMHATKEAMLAYEHDPRVKSYIFYMDLRAAGKGFQEYIARGERDYNISYIRGRAAKITEDHDENPIVWYEEAESSKTNKIAVELAVLATSLMPRSDAVDLSEILGVELDEYNFFKTDPLSPLDTTRPGIFACGCCREPTDIPESVAQASGAAARAAEAVSR